MARPHPAGRSILGRSQQVGLVVTSGIVPTTFTRSLSQRSWKDQGLITGLASGATFLLTTVTQDLLDTLGEGLATALPFPADWTLEQRREAATFGLDVVAVPIGLGFAALLGMPERESMMRGFVRQAGWRLGLTGVGGTALLVSSAASRRLDAAVGAEGRIARFPLAIPAGLAIAGAVEWFRQRDTPPEHVADPARANPALGLAAGAGVVVAIATAAAGETFLARELGSVGHRLLPGSEQLWRRAGHLVALGGLAAGTHLLWTRAMQRIESGAETFDDGIDASAAGMWTTPMISGDPASLVSWDGMGREGRRHAVTYVRPEPMADKPAEVAGVARPELSIATVMQEPARATPIEVYVGLDNAATPRERVDLALAELDRTDAWSRSLLMLVSPTGTGYVNYVAVAAAQYLTRGDVATVTLQYSKRPSPLSLTKVHDAGQQNRLLWLRILERIRELPPEGRPRVVVFGESLGAHTSQAPFVGWGTLGPEALGIDRALWIGTPAGSKWRLELEDPHRLDVDSGRVAIVNDYEQFRELGDEARAQVRYVLLSHDNDGVTKFSAHLLSSRPPWLRPGRSGIQEVPHRSPRGIPASMRWRPVTSFFQLLVDMKNAQVPGPYRAWAHDYRPDLPEFVRDVFGLECSDEQLDRVKAACEQREQFRESVFH